MTLFERDREKFQEGVEAGIEKGIEQGRKEAKLELAKSLLDVLSIEVIAEKIGLPIEIVEKLREVAEATA